MAKTKISEFSSTAADNTDITNINIAEGCSPANLNNAVRSLMALLKDQQTGSSGDPFTVAGTLVASGQAVLSGTLNVTGSVLLDGTAGASGQILLSAGNGNTPTWGAALGTMASQNATAVSITGGTITGITDLTVADGGTGASSITANSVILGNGTSALSGNLVAPSTSGNVLTSNGTTWVSSAAPTAITRATSQDTTSGTSITFSSIPSTVKRITMIFNGVSTNGGSNFQVQIGSGSTTTSGYNGVSVLTGSSSAVSSYSGSGFLFYDNGVEPGRTGYGHLVLTNISGNIWVASGQIGFVTRSIIVWTNGNQSLSGALDRIVLTTVNGTDTFDAGSVNIMYE